MPKNFEWKDAGVDVHGRDDIQDLAKQLLSWKAFSSNGCVQQTCDVSVTLFCYTEHNHYKDEYLIEMGNRIYIGNGCFTQKSTWVQGKRSIFTHSTVSLQQ